MANDTDSLVVSPSDPAGAPADEIEITPKMIAAGLEAYAYCNEDYGSLEDGVIAIFRAMYQANKS